MNGVRYKKRKYKKRKTRQKKKDSDVLSSPRDEEFFLCT